MTTPTNANLLPLTERMFHRNAGVVVGRHVGPNSFSRHRVDEVAYTVVVTRLRDDGGTTNPDQFDSAVHSATKAANDFAVE